MYMGVNNIAVQQVPAGYITSIAPAGNALLILEVAVHGVPARGIYLIWPVSIRLLWNDQSQKKL